MGGNESALPPWWGEVMASLRGRGVREGEGQKDGSCKHPGERLQCELLSPMHTPCL